MLGASSRAASETASGKESKNVEAMSEQNTSEVPAEKGYDLHDLVVFLDEDRLSEIDFGKLKDTSPHTIAVFLDRLDVDNQRAILRRFDAEQASEIIAEMESEDAAELVSEMREQRAINVLHEMDPDDAADIVGELEQEDRDRLMEGLQKSQPETAETVRELLEYPPDSAGGIMNPNVAALDENITVDEAIEYIRKTEDEYENVHYIYVVDADYVLRGVLSMRDLVLARKNVPLREIMHTDLIGLAGPMMDRSVVAQIMADTNFHAIPVVDGDGRLLGIVTHDDIMDVIREESTEDMQRLAGAGGDEAIMDNIFESLRQRSPWLVVNLATAFVASSVVGAFQDQISHLALLAVFMPIIAGIGGNTGTQTLAVTVRSLGMGEIGLFDAPQVCLRESLKGFINGVVIGALAALIALVSTRRFDFAAVVWLAMLLNMTLGGLVGSLIPFTLAKFKLDPASGSSIFTTGFTDTGGFLIFLGLGSYFLL